MLVNLNDVLIPARENKYAVGLFNTVNMEMARGVMKAAEENSSPVIIGTAEVLLPYCPLEELSYLLIPMAERTSVPVVVHYDHGLTFEKCIEALKLGFTSVMYDCSTLSFEENISRVKELTYIAHYFGATVEAELGHVGEAAEVSRFQDPSDFYTDPEQALDYVNQTGVDALAIAVGTAHGAYKFKPKLDFDRISKIRDTIPVPLVLHGGSGLSEADFRKAIWYGISKINIFTDINLAALDGVNLAVNEGGTALTDTIPYQVDRIAQVTAEKMMFFDSIGRG